MNATLRKRIVEDYTALTPASASLYQRARGTLAGGVSGNLRHFAPYPFYMSGAQGCLTTDIDGNTYVDCFMGNGPLLLGHRHPALIDRIDNAGPFGSMPFNPTLMVDCAEQLTAMVPCAERLRFLNTGTEAVMMALRYARAFTGKSRIIKFFGHYHGQQDAALFGVGGTRAALSAGVPARAGMDMILLPCHDLDAVRAAFEKHGDVAAVILDPAMHAGGLWPVRTDYLEGLRELTHDHGSLLIFDEVITGFRVAAGGAQAHHGVTPDLTTLAKALAAGEKLSAVAGRADVMAVVDPEASAEVPRVFQSGTSNDGVVALAAASAAMTEYRKLQEDGAYEQLADRARRLEEGLAAAFATRGIPCCINRFASMLQIHAGIDAAGFESALALDPEPLALFFHALINEGVFLTVPTSGHIYLSFAHQDTHIDLILQAVERAFHRYPLTEAFLHAAAAHRRTDHD